MYYRVLKPIGGGPSAKLWMHGEIIHESHFHHGPESSRAEELVARGDIEPYTGEDAEEMAKKYLPAPLPVPTNTLTDYAIENERLRKQLEAERAKSTRKGKASDEPAAQ